MSNSRFQNWLADRRHKGRQTGRQADKRQAASEKTGNQEIIQAGRQKTGRQVCMQAGGRQTSWPAASKTIDGEVSRQSDRSQTDRHRKR
jgi:hypothetical protein